MAKIDPNEVVEIFKDCLFRDSEIISGEIPSDAIVVDGIINRFGFSPDRVAAHRQRIGEILLALPLAFRADKGGGWTFLNACDDIDGEQWTGLHQTMENLFNIGQAAGLCKLVLPREMWSALPGGMPYYVVDVLESLAQGAGQRAAAGKE